MTILSDVPRGRWIDAPCLRYMGCHLSVLRAAVLHVHMSLARLDQVLWSSSSLTLCQTVERATVSALIGNIFRAGIVKASSRDFYENSPYRHPDLLSRRSGCKNIEIKVACGRNNPKAHSICPGFFLFLRYAVLESERYTSTSDESRGSRAWIWALRAGFLNPRHFKIYMMKNGAPSVVCVNKSGVNALQPIFLNPQRCPYAVGSRLREELLAEMRAPF